MVFMGANYEFTEFCSMEFLIIVTEVSRMTPWNIDNKTLRPQQCI